jgi:hypothetical protein
MCGLDTWLWFENEKFWWKPEEWENKKDVKKAGFWDVDIDISGIKLWMLFLNICYSVNNVSIFSYKCH